MTDDRMFIRDVARATGVSADTLRHYERKGLLGAVPRDASGYRRYSLSAVRRVRVVRRALTIGFSLDELARIFRERAAGQPPCRRVRALATVKLADLERRIADLAAVRDGLVAIIQSWDDSLERTPANGFAHLLESLA